MAGFIGKDKIIQIASRLEENNNHLTHRIQEKEPEYQTPLIELDDLPVVPPTQMRSQVSSKTVITIGIVLTLFIACIVILVVILSQHENAAGIEHAHLEHAEGADSFDYEFVAPGPVRNYNRIPATGGFVGLDMDRILNFDICCIVESQPLICDGKSSAPGGLAIDGFVDLHGRSVFIQLWLSGAPLEGAKCHFSGHLRGS